MIGTNNSPEFHSDRPGLPAHENTPGTQRLGKSSPESPPKVKVCSKNPNSEHTRARHDPQSTIFNIFCCKNDVRRSRKPLGPILTLKKNTKNKIPQNLENPENPEHPENFENRENLENPENFENLGNPKNPENHENVEDPGNFENPEEFMKIQKI